jgi:SAM-dependent methyltransferase
VAYEHLPPVPDADAVAENRAHWDEAATLHAGGGYDLDGVRAGRRDLGGTRAGASFEWDEMGPVAGLRVCHLQCHIGSDTVLFAGRGAAEVVGVDFSAPALAALADLAATMGLADRVRGVEADVAGAVAATGGGFDLVYTSWGVLTWNPDVDTWAATVAGLLRPGGRLYLADSHPTTCALDAEADGTYRVTWPARGGAATRVSQQGTYASPDATLAAPTSQEWAWGIGEVVTALLRAGLVLEHLAEHDVLTWALWPTLVEGDDGYHRAPDTLPLSFSLRAGKPA